MTAVGWKACIMVALALLGGCSQTAPIHAPPQQNRLVIYTPHKHEVYDSIVKEFEKRTGIWVQVETGGTAELLERIANEAAEPRCDVIFGGGVESLEAYKSLLEPYDSPELEAIYKDYRAEDNSWVPFSSLPMVIIYNPKLVTGSRPVSWSSLLEPYWQGKIAFADPELSGTAYTALATMLQALPLDREETLRRFVHNLGGRALVDGQLPLGSGDVVSAVADGSCTIGVTLEETALRGIAAGYDIAMAYPQEGTGAVPDGAAIISGCQHKENAQLFIDFVLSADVQQRLGSYLSRRPVRAELHVPESQTHGLVLLDYDLEWASSSRGEILALWKQLIEEAES